MQYQGGKSRISKQIAEVIKNEILRIVAVIERERERE